MEHQLASPATEAKFLMLDQDSRPAPVASVPSAPKLVNKNDLIARVAVDANDHVVKARKARRVNTRDDGLAGTFCKWIEAHQIGLSMNLLLLLALTHLCFPRARQSTWKFFDLSYYDENTNRYTQGYDDFPFVFFWVVAFTALRAGTMDYVLKPLARLGGIRSKKACVRFAEQGWLAIYYSFSWAVGMYIYYHSPYWLNLTEIWTNFPTNAISGLMKRYYLVQFAFWLQQIFVINMEARRKDHWQMFTHHIITCALIFASYSYYQTKVGNVILCLMDVVDIFLSGAKILKYLGYQTACDVGFGIFIVSWTVARHVLYIMVMYSIWTIVPVVMPYGCYDSVSGFLLPDSPTTPANGGGEIMKEILQPFRDPSGVVCFNDRIRMSFLGLLGGLQVITLLWFYMIIKVAYRVLAGQGADDTRSDDEGEDEEEEDNRLNGTDPEDNLRRQEKPGKEVLKITSLDQKPLEQEVGVEGLAFNTPTRRRSERLYKRSASRASGISIPGHSDRKELLGRIGCDKPVSE
ncbi:TLC domain-containing protein [Phyllosticta citriasiana]|uniref:TLC domain-containing protein n=1 Tax=Phyllosticta citriasiana TaxID=595635 RepID=UPI0030FD6487